MSNLTIQHVANLTMSIASPHGLHLAVNDDLSCRFTGQAGFEARLDSPLKMGSVGEYRKEVERILTRYQDHLWGVLQRERDDG